MAGKTKIVEIEGKKFHIEELDCLRARRVALLMDDKEHKVENFEECRNILFAKVKMDAGNGVLVSLDTEEIITQNLSLKGLVRLEAEASELTFGFLAGDGEQSPVAASKSS